MKSVEKIQISLKSDKKYQVPDAKAAVGVTMFTARYFCPILTKSGFWRQILNTSLVFHKISLPPPKKKIFQAESELLHEEGQTDTHD